LASTSSESSRIVRKATIPHRQRFFRNKLRQITQGGTWLARQLTVERSCIDVSSRSGPAMRAAAQGPVFPALHC
jgi:hypothetical protein